jgi:hypothetical protein
VVVHLGHPSLASLPSIPRRFSGLSSAIGCAAKRAQFN